MNTFFTLGTAAILLSCIAIPHIQAANSEFDASGRAILDRARARAESLATRPDLTDGTYVQTTRTRVLNEHEQIESDREATYEVHHATGRRVVMAFNVDGRVATETELRDEIAKEAARTNATGEAGDAGANWLSAEVIERYEFALKETEILDGRPTHRIEFRPASDAPPRRSRLDQVLDRVAGQLWIDATEYEIVRAEISLLENQKVRGGFVAAMDGFSFSLQRRRSADGTWFNAASRLQVEGRRFFARTRLDIVSNTREFRPATEPVTGASVAFASAGRP